MTGETIKRVPEGWISINLGKTCDFERGIEPGSAFYNSDEIGERFLRVVDLTESRDEKLYVDITTNKRALETDILMTLDGSVGIVKTGLTGIFSTGIRKVKFKDNKKSNRLLYYLLQCRSIQKTVALYSTGSTIKHAGSAIPYLECLIPSLYEEQEKIAEILASVDDTIKKTDLLIKKHQSIKQGLMQNLFRYGIDEHGRIRTETTHNFKDSHFGRIPEEWEVVELGTYTRRGGGSVQTGPFGSQLHAVDYVEDGIPIITVEHLNNGKIAHEYVPRVNERDYERLIKYSLKEGDSIYSRVGAIDRCSYVSSQEDGWLFSGRCLRVRPGKLLNPKFLSYLLNSHHPRTWILNNAVGSTMKCLNTAIISALPISIPSDTNEQSGIASVLTSIDEVIDKEEIYKQKLIDQKHGIMEDLLSGAVRVNH